MYITWVLWRNNIHWYAICRNLIKYHHPASNMSVDAMHWQLAKCLPWICELALDFKCHEPCSPKASVFIAQVVRKLLSHWCKGSNSKRSIPPVFKIILSCSICDFHWMDIKTAYCMWQFFSDVMHVTHEETPAEVILMGQVFLQVLPSACTHKQRTVFIFSAPKISEYSVNKFGYIQVQVSQK